LATLVQTKNANSIRTKKHVSQIISLNRPLPDEMLHLLISVR